MTIRAGLHPRTGITSAITLRPVQPDDFNVVRYIHATGFRSGAYSHYAPEELDAYEDMVRSPGYVDNLLSDNLIGGWLDGQLIATAAWRKANNNSDVGRITALFVRPLFERAGIGTRMLQAIEIGAATAGCRLASVRAPLSAERFFAARDYKLAGHGTRPLPNGNAINVVFMRKDLGLQRKAMKAAWAD